VVTATPKPRPVSLQAAGDPNGIYIQAEGSDKKTYLTNKGQGPVWSPDGTMIAYTLMQPEIDLVGVDVIKKDGTLLYQYRSQPGFVQFPAWLPDGKLVLAKEIGAAAGSAIYRVDLQIGQEQRLTSQENADEAYPQLAADNAHIVFSGEPGLTLYVIDLNGQNRQRLSGSIEVWDQSYYPWRTRSLSQ
jgi:Tol biopolymer transport system component